MCDEILKQFRKGPSPVFAKTLYERLTQQDDADLSPLTPSPDSREDSKAQEEQEDKDVNASLHFAVLPRLPRRQTYRREGRLVTLVAAVAAIVIGVAAFNAVYNANVPAGLAQQKTESPTALFERYINEAWNAGKTDLLTDLLAADHACYEPGQAKSVGVAHMVAMIKNYRAAFPNWQFAIKDVVASDDAVWARLVGTGTQSGPFTWTEGVTVNATNSAVTVEMVVIARFANGKIAEQRFQYDALGLLGQLKAVSSPDIYLIEQRNLGLVRRGIDNWNRHDIEALTAMPADPKHFTWAWGIDRLKTEQHPEGATKSMFERGVFVSFPDLQLTITNLVAAGDTVVVETRARGTFKSPVQFYDLSGIPIKATNKVESWSWLLIYRFDKDGKMVENRWYWDGFPLSG